MSADLVNEHADFVAELIGSGKLFSVRIEPGDTPEQRAAVIDHHESVVRELRRRGLAVRATVHREAGSEYMVIAGSAAPER